MYSLESIVQCESAGMDIAGGSTLGIEKTIEKECAVYLCLFSFTSLKGTKSEVNSNAI